MSIPDYMRVRGYLYNLITKPGSNDQRIPSENELCKLFGVSRITVRGAIKGLVKDKYLLPMRGVGTFVNAEVRGLLQRTPIIGLLSGDGRPSTGHHFMPSIEKCIVSAGMRYSAQYLPESGDPKIFLESAKAAFSGIIWLDPVKEAAAYVASLSKAAIPTLCVTLENASPPSSGGDVIFSGIAERGEKLAEFLHSHGHRRMLLVHELPEPLLKEILKEGSTHDAYCKRMATLCGGRPQKTEVVALKDLKARLSENAAAFSEFSAIYSMSQNVPQTMKVLTDAGLKVPKDFSYVVYGDSAPFFFDGLTPVRLNIGQAISSAIVKWLATRIMRETQGAPSFQDVLFDIIPGETVANIKRKGEQ